MAIPDGDTLHHALSEALEGGVANRDWFLWLDVSGGDPHPDFSSLIEQTERWLAQQDPDARELATTLSWQQRGLHVEIRAEPKKPRARGAQPLVGNPYPAFAYWVT